ncbi:hypothetical protein LOD99_3542 [Oopsacas minuta]|uniref:Uncharacterized protein n=1 Tax=Oopsacas minuta TaxID=111878 RepID=A0AAV7JXP6_9METZ|nr:hypothetical protein LOD99_3542 [Oopsacas minuta]
MAGIGLMTPQVSSMTTDVWGIVDYVVTNKDWVCSTYHYGPTNWKECFGAQTVRNQSEQLIPVCKQNETQQLIGCESRQTDIPVGWTMDGFDDSRWNML